MTAALILQLLNMIQAGFNWLAQRGVTRDRAIALIDKAAAENRDVTSAEVQTELDTLQDELDDTADAIGDLPE
jgi:phage-related minor tail protein